MRSNVRNSSAIYVQRMSPSHVQLLKAALLDGDAAIAAYRAWRPTLDLAKVTHGHRIFPLLQRNLTRLGISDSEMNRFRGIRRYFWAQNLKAMTFATPVFAALDEARIPFIVLKGAALVVCYFHDRSLRPMSDIDVLVPEERLADTVAVLEELELFPDHTSGEQLSHFLRRLPGWQFIGPNRGLDLHWKALHLDRRPHADDGFWRARRKVLLDGREISVLDPADQLLHICAHAAQSTAGPAAHQWPADASFVIRGSPDLSYERLVAEARKHHLSGVMAGALEFLVRELEMPVPSSVVEQLYGSAHWIEHSEMRMLAEQGPASIGASDRLLLEFQNFRRGDPNALDRRMAGAILPFLKAWTGTAGVASAVAVATQAIFGSPTWLRRLLGRDRHRVRPDVTKLPKIGDGLDLTAIIDETTLVAGWSIPDPLGRWSLDHEATIAWHVEECPDDLTLHLDGYVLLYEEAPTQHIEVYLNDKRIACWDFRFGESPDLPAETFVPRSLLKGNDVAFLTFTVESPRSPAEFQVSDDSRPLGLHLRSAALRTGRSLPHGGASCQQAALEVGAGP